MASFLSHVFFYILPPWRSQKSCWWLTNPALIPGSSKCVKFVPFQPNNQPKGRNFTYLEDPGITHIEKRYEFFKDIMRFQNLCSTPFCSRGFGVCYTVKKQGIWSTRAYTSRQILTSFETHPILPITPSKSIRRSSGCWVIATDMGIELDSPDCYGVVEAEPP